MTVNETLRNVLSQRINRYHRFATTARQDQDMLRTSKLVAFLILLIGTLDAISTNVALNMGAVEVNVAMRSVQSSLGSMWFIPKMLMHAVVVSMIIWAPNRFVLFVVASVIVVNATVVLNNFHIISMLS